MIMRKKFWLAAVLILWTVSVLSGCTKQRNMDISEFCKRVNTEQGTQVLAPENFFRELADTVREYNCHMPITQNCTALLSLTADSTDTVTALQLTCIPDAAPYTSEDFAALYQAYITLCAVLTVQEPDDAEAAVRMAGILPESLEFSEYGFVGEAEKHRYSVFSGEQYISLFCERI